jgi:hypothetical protein
MPLVVTVGCLKEHVRYARDLLRRNGASSTRTIPKSDHKGTVLVEGIVRGIADPESAKADEVVDGLNSDMKSVVTFQGMWLDEVSKK